MENESFLDHFVSPVTGKGLVYQSGKVIAEDNGIQYPISGEGIIDLVDNRLWDDVAESELQVFDNLPISAASYFRNTVYQTTCESIAAHIDMKQLPASIIELGGGAGYLATAMVNSYPSYQGYVADLSYRALQNADRRLCRIRCDIRYPYLRKKSVGVAVFWVSLHHLTRDDMARAIRVASNTIAPGGLLVFFEPNGLFLPRRAFYGMKISKNVYFDEEEKPIFFNDVSRIAEQVGLSLLEKFSTNPPYSLMYLRQLKLWQLFFVITELLYRLSQFKKNRLPIKLGSYITLFYRKK